jgi:hypothetical protein
VTAVARADRTMANGFDAVGTIVPAAFCLLAPGNIHLDLPSAPVLN